MGNSCCKCKYLRNQTRKEIVLLLVGLDNAGKTTAARGLAGDAVDYTIPTVGFSAIKPRTKGFNVTIYDLGGGVQIRDIWRMYFHYVHGVIYVVDASDISRIEESKHILENLLLDEKLAGKPVLVLANKQDKPYALDEIDIVEALQLEPLVNRQRCHTLVKVCSARPVSASNRTKIDKRLLEGYRWLLYQIVREYSILNQRVENDSKAEAARLDELRALQRKRLEKSESNGVETNHTDANGISAEETSTILAPATPEHITSSIRGQLEQRNERPRFALSKGKRSNKIHPESLENMRDFSRPRSALSSPVLTSDTSMTIRAITSPLHVNRQQNNSLAVNRNANGRPLTTRSLEYNTGVWGLNQEMDIIYPSEVIRHVEDEGVKDEILVEYLKPD